MATTANGLPYPVGTDRVMDGDDAIKALAQALDPPWTALVLAASWTPRAGSLAPAYRVIAGVVHLRGQAQKATTITQGESCLTLPADARPTGQINVPYGAARSGGGNGGCTGRFDIAVAGTIQVYADGATISTWASFDGVSFSK